MQLLYKTGSWNFTLDEPCPKVLLQSIVLTFCLHYHKPNTLSFFMLGRSKARGERQNYKTRLECFLYLSESEDCGVGLSVGKRQRYIFPTLLLNEHLREILLVNRPERLALRWKERRRRRV